MNDQILRVGVLAAAVFLTALPASAQVQEPPLTTDEFLGYSLDSVRSRLNEVAQENQQIAVRNKSIRDRAYFLREEARTLEGKLKALKEDASDVRRLINLDATEFGLEQKQLDNLLERRRHLIFQRDVMSKQMEALRLERGLFEQDANDTGLEVKELHGVAKVPIKSQMLNFFAQEKLEFLNLLKDYQDRVAEQQKKIDAEEEAILGYLRAKEAALREAERLGLEISNLELYLKEEYARAAILAREASRIERDIKEAPGLAERENLLRRQYAGQLAVVLADLKDLRKELAAGKPAAERKALVRHLARLQEEHRVLSDYKRVLEDHGRLKDRIAREERPLIVALKPLGEWSGPRTGLLRVQEELARRQKINADFEKERKQLMQEIAALALAEKEHLEQRNVLQSGFSEKKAALESQMAEMMDHLEFLEYATWENEQLQAGIMQQEARMKEELDRQERLRQDVENSLHEVENLRVSQEKEIAERREYVQQLMDEMARVEVDGQDIEDLVLMDKEKADQYKAILNEWNEALSYQHKLLENHLKLTQLREAEKATTLLAIGELNELYDNREQVARSLDQARGALAVERESYAALERETEQLKNELTDLKIKLERISGEPLAAGLPISNQDVFDQKKALLRDFLDSEKQRLQALHEDICALEAYLERQKERLIAERERGAVLEKALEDLAADLRGLDDLKAALVEDRDAALMADVEEIEAFKELIYEAAVSKKVMEESYEVIRQKYNESVYEAGEFEKDQTELAAYLEELKTLNISLKSRLKELEPPR